MFYKIGRWILGAHTSTSTFKYFAKHFGIAMEGRVIESACTRHVCQGPKPIFLKKIIRKEISNSGMWLSAIIYYSNAWFNPGNLIAILPNNENANYERGLNKCLYPPPASKAALCCYYSLSKMLLGDLYYKTYVFGTRKRLALWSKMLMYQPLIELAPGPNPIGTENSQSKH